MFARKKLSIGLSIQQDKQDRQAKQQHRQKFDSANLLFKKERRDAKRDQQLYLAYRPHRRNILQREGGKPAGGGYGTKQSHRPGFAPMDKGIF